MKIPPKSDLDRLVYIKIRDSYEKVKAHGAQKGFTASESFDKVDNWRVRMF